MKIIDLQEVSPNLWKAKYNGNYGIYTIKIKKEGEKTVDFSCSCPSDYYPCKHIPMIEEAIRERVAKRKKSAENSEINLEQLLKDISHKELCDFIIAQANYNSQLKNEILLQFSHKIEKKETETSNNYAQLLRNALAGVYFDYDDIGYDYELGYDYCNDIDVLDKWLDKAQEYVNQNNPNEAILICKACIEEFATWCAEQESDIVEYVNIDYQERPFNILEQVLHLQEVDCKGLLDYCKSEMLKPKYKKTEMYDGFNDLLSSLSVLVGSDDYITLQNKLLQEIEDKSSYEFKTILKRKINFYRSCNQEDKAREIIEENIQIEDFREELIKKLIDESRLKEAKKLINDLISAAGNEGKHLPSWHVLKLQIAQKENDIPEIRRISYRFIESHFDSKNFKIYKSTFTQEEWEEKVEKLIQHYEKRYKGGWFNTSVAEVLQTENQKERLMRYIEKHLSVDNLDRYHTVFSSSFPEKTLALFRQAIDEYAQNTGRTYYEHIVRLFEKMVKIEGGKEVVREMIQQYRVIYKNRKAMMEILNEKTTRLG